MNKLVLLISFSILYSFSTNAQDDYSLKGFNGIYIGTSKKSLKKLKLVESKDSINGCWETSGKGYIISNKKKNNFMGAPIMRVYLTFNSENEVSSIYVLIETNEIMSQQLLNKITAKFGDTNCSFSVSFDPPPLYCDWENGEDRMLVSNMKSPGGGTGRYLHIQYL